eukprot:1098016-Alexandrium_andersonii.AAC.1
MRAADGQRQGGLVGRRRRKPRVCKRASTSATSCPLSPRARAQNGRDCGTWTLTVPTQARPTPAGKHH